MRSHIAIAIVVLLLTAQGGRPAQAQSCKCNSYRSATPKPAAALPNAAQKVARLCWTHLREHVSYHTHHIALVAAAMFDAHAYAERRPRVTDAAPTSTRAVKGMSTDAIVGYAGYAAMHAALVDDAGRQAALARDMRQLGFGSESKRIDVGLPFATAVAAKYPLGDELSAFRPPNPPSSSANADCKSLRNPLGWQPLCVVTRAKGNACVSQTRLLPLRYFAASVMSENGERVSVNGSGAGKLGKLKYNITDLVKFRLTDRFAEQTFGVVRQMAQLDDARKMAAETFSADATLSSLHLLLDELALHDTNLVNSVRFLWMVTGGMRDALVVLWTDQFVRPDGRPISALQCGLRNAGWVKSWLGPYKGVDRLRKAEGGLFQSYIPTSAEPGFGSTEAGVSYAATIVMDRELPWQLSAANCVRHKAGSSVIEPRIDAGKPGYIKGVTDVPNKGAASVGYSPAKEVIVCWKTFLGFAQQHRFALKRSGQFSGRTVGVGSVPGRWAGLDMWRYVRLKNYRN